MRRSERKLIEAARHRGLVIEIKTIIGLAPDSQKLCDEIFAYYQKDKKLFLVGGKKVGAVNFVNQLLDYVRVRGFETLPAKVREILGPDRKDLKESKNLVQNAINAPDAYML